MARLKGFKFSAETLLKMSESQKGNTNSLGCKRSDETKEKLRQANLGKHPSDETKLKMSLSAIGRIVSDETKLKIGLAHSGENNSNFGKHPSEETLIKMSLARTGEKNHFYGKHHTDEAKKKMSAREYKTGVESSSYKNGTYTDKYGYIGILSPEHPNKDKRGYVYQHRLAMEKLLGRYLTREEQIHHINEITNDNRIENLMLFASNSEHKKYHAQLKKQKIA